MSERTPLDDIVVGSGNNQVYRQILEILAPHDEAVCLYLYGEHGVGKTALAEAACAEKPASGRVSLFTHAGEIWVSIHQQTNEAFLEKLATVDRLFIDGFDDFLTEGDAGVLACGLLVKERLRNGKDTVLIGAKPLAAYDLGALEDALSGFSEICVGALEGVERIEFARNRIDKYFTAGASPVLDDEVAEYLAGRFVSLRDMERAIMYLEKAADLPAGQTVTVDVVDRLLVV